MNRRLLSATLAVFGSSMGVPAGAAAASLMVAEVKATEAAGELPVVELTQVAAQTAQDLQRFEKVVTWAEVSATLQQSRREQILGCSDEECIIELGQMVQAEMLIFTTIGAIGEELLLTASLIDVAAGTVTERASLTLGQAQVEEAIRVAVRRLFGTDAELEPLPGAKTELNQIVAGLATEIATQVKKAETSQLDRLGYLPFVAVGEATSQREMGMSIWGVLRDSLVKGHAVKIVDEQRVVELGQEMNVARNDQLGADDLKAAARFLGSNLVLRGLVSDIGDHFLVSVNLISAESGEEIWNGRVALARGGLSELAAKALVRRTTAGSVIRAFIVPGWGQFYNGPEHTVTGALVLAGASAGLAAAGTMFYLASRDYDAMNDWTPDRPTKHWAPLGCDVDPAPCQKEHDALEDSGDRKRLLGFGGLGIFAAFYAWGIVDAAMNAEDYSEATLSVAPTFAPRDGTGMHVGLTVPW